MTVQSPLPGSRLATNILSSYGYFALAALITLFVVPIYVNALGAAQWGSVALCLTLQGILFAIDVALGPLMLRDVARADAAGRLTAVFRGFLLRYGGIALVLFTAGQFAVAWLDEAPELTWVIRLALLQFLFQFANNAATGLWHGLQRQGFANTRLAGFTLARHAAAVLVVTQWNATPVALFLPFALVAALEFCLNLRRVLRELAARPDNPGSSIPPAPWRAGLLFVAAAALGICTAHLDRVFLSLHLPPEQFGVYFLIGSLMLSLLHLQLPVQRAFLPPMATTDSPRAVGAAMLRVSLVLLVLPCLLLALFPERLLLLWLGDASIAESAAEPLRLLLIAAALNALYGPTSLLLLRQHRYGLMTSINASALGAQLLVLVLLTPRLGMTAGALAWGAGGLVQLAWAVQIHWRDSGAKKPMAPS